MLYGIVLRRNSKCERVSHTYESYCVLLLTEILILFNEIETKPCMTYIMIWDLEQTVRETKYGKSDLI